jgi:hypothetical protein
MKPRALLERLSETGSAAQATIPGLYAWAVTVAPAAWGRGGSLLAKLIALLGLVFLVGGVLVELRRPRGWGRHVATWGSVWGLVGTSVAVWALSPAALLPARLDAPRGIAGMIGWALFAFASAAPALPRDPDLSRVAQGAPLRPRAHVPGGDAAFIVVGMAVALALQAIGWHVAVPERALLVRLVALASGLAVIGAATQLALARHARRTRPSRQVRTRRALVPVTSLIALAVAGVALLLAGR